MRVCPAEPRGGWLMNPFHKKEPVFFACSDECKSNAEAYYLRYGQTVGQWAAGFVVIFSLSFLSGIFFGYPVFRWAMPAAIGLGGIWMSLRPYTNNFRRDKSGSLKTSLARSLQEGRWTGILFVVIALILAFINTLQPAIPLIPY